MIVGGHLHELCAAICNRLIKLTPNYAELRALPSSATADILRPAVSEFNQVDRLRTILFAFDDDATSSRSPDRVITPRSEAAVGEKFARASGGLDGFGTGGGPPNSGMRGMEEHPGDFVVTLPSGHKLQGRVEGPANGTPIFQLHGTPGSRVDTAPPDLLEGLNVRLITYDRPGYGGSDLWEGLKVVDAAGHVEAIANHLRVEKFAVVGRSGGTPYAAAAAAGLPDRVTRLGLLVPVAPPALMKEKYYEGMTQQVAGLEKSFEGPTAQKFAKFLKDPTDPMGIIGIPRDKLGSVDQEIVDKHSENLCKQFAEGLKNGYQGWLNDLEQYGKDRPWGFDIGDIECPTIVWTASGDGFTPSAHAERITAQLPQGQGRLYTVPGGEVGHFGAHEIKPGAYAWLAGRDDLTLFPGAPPSGHSSGALIPTRLEQWTSYAERSAG